MEAYSGCKIVGTWQEYCVAPLDKLYAVPDSLSCQLAAIAWSNPVISKFQQYVAMMIAYLTMTHTIVTICYRHGPSSLTSHMYSSRFMITET